MKTRDVLLAARALIEQGWTQGCAARESKGYPVSSTYGGATQFCAAGALERAVGESGDGFKRAVEAQTHLRTALEARTGKVYPSVSEYNDKSNRTKEEILSLFDEAILIAEKEEVR